MASRCSRKRPQSPWSVRGLKIAAISACSAAAVWANAGAQQPSERARTEALARRAGDRLVALQREADRLASEERTLLTELRALEVDRQLKAEALKRADTEVRTVQAELDDSGRRMEALQASEAAERPELRGRLVEMYKLGRARY